MVLKGSDGAVRLGGDIEVTVTVRLTETRQMVVMVVMVLRKVVMDS